VQSTAHANAYAERFIGSARRECFDHVIVLSATGLHRLMKLSCTYYEHSRTHLSLNKDAPIARPNATLDGRVVAVPQVAGLHHRYERQAAYQTARLPTYQPESLLAGNSLRGDNEFDRQK
jgi:hypothetical protein